MGRDLQLSLKGLRKLASILYLHKTYCYVYSVFNLWSRNVSVLPRPSLSSASRRHYKSSDPTPAMPGIAPTRPIHRSAINLMLRWLRGSRKAMTTSRSIVPLLQHLYWQGESASRGRLLGILWTRSFSNLCFTPKCFTASRGSQMLTRR